MSLVTADSEWRQHKRVAGFVYYIQFNVQAISKTLKGEQTAGLWINNNDDKLSNQQSEPNITLKLIIKKESDFFNSKKMIAKLN